MRPYVADVLEGLDWFDHQVHYDPRSKDHELRPTRAISHLRALEPEVAVLLPNSLRTAWMAWRSGARRRVGVARDLRGWLLTDRVGQSRRDLKSRPQIDRYLEVAEAAGFHSPFRDLELATTAADESAADAIWRRLNLPAGDRVAVLNSGGAYGSAKHWPVTHFAALAQRLVNQRGMHVLVNCGPAERRIARDIVELAGLPQVVSLADFEVPLGLTKAVIRRARLLVTTDSGPRFFGVAFGRAVVTLHGPTPVAMTRTGSPTEVQISLDLDCQPCLKRSCPLGHHQCMVGLTVDRVLAGVDRALAVSGLAGEAA